MDKIFNVEIDGQITLPDGRKLGPFEETTVNVVQPSECAPDPIVENAKQTGGVYTSSLTYGTPDTIHKIDEKYLPGTQEKNRSNCHKYW